MSHPRARTPGWISIGSSIVLVFLGGCGFLSSPVPPGKSVREAYEETANTKGQDKLRIEREDAPGTPQRVRPIIYPPKIFAVFVPEHLDLDRDYKIGSHWIYMKLRDSSWTEEAIDREPASQGEASSEDLERLKPVATRGRLSKMLLPYRASSQEKPDSRSSAKDKSSSEKDTDLEIEGTQTQTKGDRP